MRVISEMSNSCSSISLFLLSSGFVFVTCARAPATGCAFTAPVPVPVPVPVPIPIPVFAPVPVPHDCCSIFYELYIPLSPIPTTPLGLWEQIVENPARPKKTNGEVH